MNYIKIIRRECRSRDIPTVLFLPHIIKSFNAFNYTSEAVISKLHDVARLVRAYIRSFNVGTAKHEKALIYSGASI